jgi:hypothetical protein
VAGAVISPNSLAESTDLGHRSTWSAAGVIALVALFYALTMRTGLPWADDYALYYAHARNLVTGQPYANTGYIYNPFQPELGPAVYPPFFPLVLAPVVAFVGWNPSLLKIPGVLLFLASLWYMFTCLRQRIPCPYAVAAVAFMGFNPYLWLLKDVPTSDTAFLFLVFFTFLCISAAERRGWPWKHSAAVGTLLYLCFACRAAGIVLGPSLFLAEIAKRRRRPRPGIWLSLGIGFVGMALQMALLPGEGSYADQEHLDIPLMARHTVDYAWWVRKMLFALSGPGGSIVLCLLLVTGLIGYWIAIRRSITILEIFGPAYLALVLLWTSDPDGRLLLPIVPLWFLYVSIAVLRLREIRKPRLAGAVAGALASLFLCSYASYFAGAPYGPITDGPADKGFVSACHFLVAQTRPETAVLFRRPRLLAVLTGRKSSIYPFAADRIVSYATKIGATYVVTGEPFAEDRKILIPAVTSRPDLFQAVFRSGGFAVYRLLPAR